MLYKEADMLLSRMLHAGNAMVSLYGSCITEEYITEVGLNRSAVWHV